MQISIVLAALGAVGFTSAAPMEKRAADVEAAGNGSALADAGLSKRAITHVFMCVDKDFTGPCQNLQTNTGDCHNLGSPFNNAVTSLGPDQGTTCTLYDGDNCSGRSLGGIVHPGINDLNDFNFNDIASSYKCV